MLVVGGDNHQRSSFRLDVPGILFFTGVCQKVEGPTIQQSFLPNDHCFEAESHYEASHLDENDGT